MNDSAKQFLKTYTQSGVLHEVSKNAQGKIILLHDKTFLKSKYHLSDTFLKQLDKFVSDINKKESLNSSISTQEDREVSTASSSLSTSSDNSIIVSDIFVSDWKVYFTESDVQTFLLVAAEVGPAAMDVALDGVATLVGGPVGTVISVILDIVGAASMTNLCYLVIQATYLNEGVYVGIQWNGPFPNYTEGLW